MNEAFVRRFAATALFFLLALLALTGVRTTVLRERTRAAASAALESIPNTQRIKRPDAARSLLGADERWQAIAWYRPDGDVEYGMARDSSLLREPRSDGNPWDAGYAVPMFSHAVVRVPSGTEGGTLEGVYRVVDERSMFPVIRDTTVAAAALLILGATVLLVASSQQRVQDRPAPDNASKAAVGIAEPVATTAPTPAPTPTLAYAAEVEIYGQSGLVRGPYLRPRLRSELARAGSTDLDLCLALGVIDGELTPTARGAVAGLVRDIAYVPDLVFDYGSQGFAVIIPEADLDAGIDLLEELRGSASSESSGQVTVSVGLSDRNGRLVSERRLLLEAKKALQKAVAGGGNQVIAFRADPVRFRKVHSDV